MNWNPTWICLQMIWAIPLPFLAHLSIFEKKITHANLTITAMGVYEARLNGRRVGQFVMAPGWTSYHKRLQYQEYDITDLLTNGKNEIEVTVGKGWYRSPLPGWLGCAYQDELRSRPCGLAAQITLTFEDAPAKSYLLMKAGRFLTVLYVSLKFMMEKFMIQQRLRCLISQLPYLMGQQIH